MLLLKQMGSVSVDVFFALTSGIGSHSLEVLTESVNLATCLVATQTCISHLHTYVGISALNNISSRGV